MTSDLRARVEALAEEWEAEAAEDQAWLNGPRVEVSEAYELPALIRQAGAHVRELRALLAEPAAEDIRAKVERSSLGTPEAQALRATVSDEHAARIVARAKELDASDPAPAADGGEVEVDSLVRLLARHVLSHLTPEHCTADCMARAILASPLLADLRRTERAEGAREALLSAAEEWQHHLRRDASLYDYGRWLDAAANMLRARAEATR